jgi:tetratricopeptide (TPR) repeat protein
MSELETRASRRRGGNGRRACARAVALGVCALAVLAGCTDSGRPAARDRGGAALADDAIVGTAQPGVAAVGGDARATTLALVDEFQQAHRFADAERLTADWLARDPYDAEMRVVRSQLRIHAGDPRGALADCMAASARLDALASSACVAQARAALGDPRGARDLVERALAAAPRDDAAASTRSWAAGIAAELASKAGDDDAAERWHRESVALAGTTHFPRLAYADFLLARQRHRDALRVLDGAPDTGEVRRRRQRAQAGA